MRDIIGQFAARIRRLARPRPQRVSVSAMGRDRVFCCYDWGSDSFIFEKDILKNWENHLPVLVVRKSELNKGQNGRIMTFTSGNHATAAIPLLTGKFWNFNAVSPSRRNQVLSQSIVYANVVNGVLEISQRDVSTQILTDADDWLQGLGIPLDGILMAERNDETLEHYRTCGEEWRIKPLAWTRKEIEFALRSSRTHINTRLTYYHSAKGVHFLSYSDFHKLDDLIREDFAQFKECLRELVSVHEGEKSSFLRMPKFHGHHEVELFGVRRGTAALRLIPLLERLMEGLTLRFFGEQETAQHFQVIDAMFKSMLERPTLADDTSTDFCETLYMHLTGEIYYTHNDLGSLAFDDRRTALPGATFIGGRPDYHPGVDERSRVLFLNVEQQLSQDEIIEYANVYEIRSENEDDAEDSEETGLGDGATREIVYKTNRRALPHSLIEKRLAQKRARYGSYVLARVQAFQELGVNFCNYKLLLLHEAQNDRDMNYYIRDRCPGEPLWDIPARIYRRVDDPNAKGGEDPRVALVVGSLLGDAAAQNLAVKKYLPQEGCRFGVGKEIFELGYNITCKREMPMRVAICSVRGNLGWPDLSCTDANFQKLIDFYFSCYADTLYEFWLQHRAAVTLSDLEDQFFDGFEFKTRAMHWCYSSRREQFDQFNPHLPAAYGFQKKWSFALWALDLQLRRIDELRTFFHQKLAAVRKGRRAHTDSGGEK